MEIKSVGKAYILRDLSSAYQACPITLLPETAMRSPRLILYLLRVSIQPLQRELHYGLWQINLCSHIGAIAHPYLVALQGQISLNQHVGAVARPCLLIQKPEGTIK